MVRVYDFLYWIYEHVGLLYAHSVHTDVINYKVIIYLVTLQVDYCRIIYSFEIVPDSLQLFISYNVITKIKTDIISS